MPPAPHGADGAAVIPRVLLIQNDVDSGPGRLPDWIRAAGAEPTVLAAYDGVAVPPHPGDADAVILLGGGLMPDADAEHPWLPAERELVRACVTHGVPVLGICLGHQLIAHALGGSVAAAHGTPERGAVILQMRPEAAEDALLAPVGASAPAIESHQDAVTGLPPNAVWLAQTEACPFQAFRVGTSTWGVQFHPEAPAERVATWDRAKLRSRGLDPDSLVATAREHAEQMEQTWSGLVIRFVDVARRRTGITVVQTPVEQPSA